MSGDEQCDDGNAQVGDGCTPSCRLELMRCEDGRRLPVGDDCEAGQDDDPDAGSSPSYREDCPRFIRTTIEPRTTIVVGQTAELSVRIEGEGNVLWMSQPDDSTLASSELFSAPDALSTRFTCPDFAQSFTIFLFTSAPGCRYPRSKTIRFHCVNAPVDPETDPNIARPAPDPVAPDTSTSDAGSSALAPDLDGGARDAGPETLDAPPGDASQPADASAADAASARGYRSLPCETCVNAACVAYSGIDFIGPCFGETLSPDFSQRCADVFFCSHHSPDLCAYNVMRGPVGCFCGESVSVDACQEGTVQGNCVPQWYAASGCTDGDHRCVLERFIDLERPSGYANFLLECKNTLCAAECAP